MSDPRYTTLEVLRSQTGVSSGDDARLSAALAAAEELIDVHCRRRFDAVDPEIDAAVARVYPADGWPDLSIDDIVQVDTVEARSSTTGDWTALDADGWDLEPLNAAADGKPHTTLRLASSRYGQIRVTGWFGWPAVPAVVSQAALLQASRLYQRKNAAFGVTPVPSLEGGAGMRLLAKLDADVENNLHGVRRHPVLVG